MEPRDVIRFCPSRYDLSGFQGSNLAGAPPRLVTIPQEHNWRQKLSHFKGSSYGLTNDGYFCTRCVARMTDEGMLTNYQFTAEERSALELELEPE